MMAGLWGDDKAYARWVYKFCVGKSEDVYLDVLLLAFKEIRANERLQVLSPRGENEET